jgi:hypothetical protein
VTAALRISFRLFRGSRQKATMERRANDKLNAARQFSQ